jgi:hypothetical protein
MPRLLDLFSGRWGWGRAFAERGWDVVGVDLVEPPEIPCDCQFLQADILTARVESGEIDVSMANQNFMLGTFDFICASSPCEEFSVHGMKHFHPNPKYPEMGIKLFNHTRALCEAAGVPYVMENVRPAQKFVGQAVNHCGPFYLWGTGVPPLMPQGISKKGDFRALPGSVLEKIKRLGLDVKSERNKYQRIRCEDYNGPTGTRCFSSSSQARKDATARAATIPRELAACVADYATRLCEVSA